MRQRDVLHMVETCYRPARDDESWAAALSEAAEPLFDHGLGVVTRIDRLHPPEAIALHVRTSSQELKRMVEQTSHATRHDALRMYRPDRGIVRLSEVVGPLGDAFSGDAKAVGNAMAKRGAVDWLHFTATDGSDHVVLIAAPLPGELRMTRSSNLWTMVAAHLSAGFRLHRQALDLLAAPRDSAIVDAASGRVVHADGIATPSDALEQIREAVRRVDRARAHEADPELALSVWEGLLDGTWSLADRHDRDGRRFIVAVPNDPDIRDPRGLSEREAQVAALASLGQSDKLIAYTLGVGRSTVATHLQRAMGKLGVATRVELARVFTPGRDPESPPEAAH